MKMKHDQTLVRKIITLLRSKMRNKAHAWRHPRFDGDHWRKKLFIGMAVVTLMCFLLVSIGIVKLHKAGWFALLLIGALVAIELLRQRHYRKTFLLLRRLDELVNVAEASGPGASAQDGAINVKYDPRGKTAVLLVNGFNGLGLHTLFSVIRLFGSSFTNFVFIQIGVLDASKFKDPEEVFRKKNKVKKELDRYVNYMQRHGYYAIASPSCGTDVVDEIARITPEVLERFPNAVFFGGQLVFPKARFLSGVFHNYTIFAVQKRFYNQGIPIVILPIRV